MDDNVLIGIGLCLYVLDRGANWIKTLRESNTDAGRQRHDSGGVYALKLCVDKCAEESRLAHALMSAAMERIAEGMDRVAEKIERIH